MAQGRASAQHGHRYVWKNTPTPPQGNDDGR
jgi:hypothetical protein